MSKILKVVTVSYMLGLIAALALAGNLQARESDLHDSRAGIETSVDRG